MMNVHGKLKIKGKLIKMWVIFVCVKGMNDCPKREATEIVKHLQVKFALSA